MPADPSERSHPDDTRSSTGKGTPGESSSELASSTRPLGRTASRVFVIASILFIIAAAAGGTYFLLSIAREAPTGIPPAMDTTRTDTAAVDSVSQLDAANPIPSGARRADDPGGDE